MKDEIEGLILQLDAISLNPVFRAEFCERKATQPVITSLIKVSHKDFIHGDKGTRQQQS